MSPFEKYLQFCRTNSDKILSAYQETHTRADNESDDDYLRRVSEQDYDDGFTQAAVFQDFWDSLH